MKIVKLEQFHADMGWRPASFLKISTDEGLVGWAEYAENFGAGGVSDLLRRFEPIIQGLDPREVGKITASLQAITRLAAGGLNNQAIAAIENACLDIKAKALGVPVYALFGGPFRTRLPVYWSHCGSFRVRFADLFETWGKPRVETLDDLKTLGQEAVARGFSAIKTNPLFLENGRLKMFEGGFRLYPKLLERNIDGAFIGARAEVAEGVIVREGAVLSMGVYLGASTKIVDRATGEVFIGEVPAYSVVVPGSLPGKPLPDGTPGPSLYCAVIVKRVDAQTRAKTGINELLRD